MKKRLIVKRKHIAAARADVRAIKLIIAHAQRRLDTNPLDASANKALQYYMKILACKKQQKALQ